MQQFVLKQNIDNFRNQLASETAEEKRRTLQMLLLSAQRDLAYLAADLTGVLPFVAPRWVPGAFSGASDKVALYWRHIENASSPYLLLDPGPGLHIVEVNDAYARATLTSRGAIVGRSLFEVFPDNPRDPSADGVNNLFRSLQIAAETGRPHYMPVQRYDVRDCRGEFLVRYWKPTNTPVLDDEGRLVCLLHHVEDVTANVSDDSLSGRAISS